MALPLDFTGKTIMVVGCHKGGMGGATCRQLAKGGATIVAVDNQQAYLDEIAAEVRELGATCHTLTADLMDVAECEKLIPRVLAQAGAIDGLVCVAHDLDRRHRPEQFLLQRGPQDRGGSPARRGGQRHQRDANRPVRSRRSAAGFCVDESL